MEVLQKIKNKTVWSSNSTFWVFIWGKQNTNLEKYLYPHVHCSIIYNSEGMETTKVSMDGWMDKENVVYVYNRIPFSHMKEWGLAIFDNMDEPRGHYTKWNKSENNKYQMIACTWNLKGQQKSKWKTDWLIDTEERLVVARDVGSEVGEMGELFFVFVNWIKFFKMRQRKKWYFLHAASVSKGFKITSTKKRITIFIKYCLLPRFGRLLSSS